MFIIKINTENAAFRSQFTGDEDASAMETELIRIIKETVIPYLENGLTDCNLHDINGNRVGRMELMEEMEEWR